MHSRLSAPLAGLILGGALLGASLSSPQVAAAQSSCDWASYPDFCVPQYPPALTCAQVGAGWFTVRPPDPHHLDVDFDGIGCEG